MRCGGAARFRRGGASGSPERRGWRAQFSAVPPGPGADADSRRRALEIATELEGHPENAAASMLGGMVVTSGGEAIRVRHRLDVEMVFCWPDSTTSTRASRATLPDRIDFDDAVFNVGRAALLVAAFAEGRADLLALATDDRLHTDRRLASVPESAKIFEALADMDVLARWLSGSGPTVAAMCVRGGGATVAAALAGLGSVRVADLAVAGVVVE